MTGPDQLVPVPESARKILLWIRVYYSLYPLGIFPAIRKLGKLHYLKVNPMTVSNCEVTCLAE
jgi:hypothetical protein